MSEENQTSQAVSENPADSKPVEAIPEKHWSSPPAAVPPTDRQRQQDRPQTPSIGRIVLFFPSHASMDESKGGQGWPAIITHVWGPTCVNLNVFQDGSYPLPCTDKPTSVTLMNTDPDPKFLGSFCVWPSRV